MIDVYCGEGKGKTTAAFGQALRVAAAGGTVTILQFLKRKNEEQSAFLSRLEPEIKLFRFEKAEESFADLSDEDKKEAVISMKNGLHFAGKVLDTGECQLLIMDEILGVLEQNIVSVQEVRDILERADGDTDIILTGHHRCEALEDLIDNIYAIDIVK